MRRIRVGIDGYNMALSHGTGIATYGRSLGRMLADSGHGIEGVFGIDAGADPALREVLFFDRLSQPEAKPLTRRQARWQRRKRFVSEVARPFLSAATQDVPITDRVEKAAFSDRLPPFARIVTAAALFDVAHRHFNRYGRFLKLTVTDPPQIMHWTYPLPIRLAGARNIYTLHDLVPLRLPYTTLDVKTNYDRLVRRCVAEADHICTVSEASRADIIALLGAAPDRVTNTYQSSPIPAAALSREAAADAAIVDGLFKLPPQGYFLYFGAIEPKKNVGRLIEAYLALQTSTPLVLVGGRAWRADGELALLANLVGEEGKALAPGRPAVLHLDYLGRDMLFRLIRGARSVVFPSLFEGFGLPVLEAMQLGSPVLTSTTSSLPEVAGDAAVMVDPYDTASITEGLRKLDEDEGLRASLSRAGLAQAARFSQDRYRERVEDMYERVL